MESILHSSLSFVVTVLYSEIAPKQNEACHLLARAHPPKSLLHFQSSSFLVLLLSSAPEPFAFTEPRFRGIHDP